MKKTNVKQIGFAILMGTVAGATVAPLEAHAQAIKPRFALILDTSSSMVENPSGQETYGDGSIGYEGCNRDGNTAGWPYDDSRLYQAKNAIADTVAGFGAAEFAFARFRGVDLGQTCTATADCPKDPNTNMVWSNVSCIRPNGNPCGGGATDCRCLYNASHYTCGTACMSSWNCKMPMNRYTTFRSTACRGSSTCAWSATPPSCKAAQVLVPFPASGSNYSQISVWLNGTEGPGDPEIRGDLGTPLGSSLDSIREWLTVPAATDVGPGAGEVVNDPRKACRSYDVILLTDGVESCNSDPVPAATRLRQTCTNGGTWDATDMRCEIAGSPNGTSSVKTYVIGFGVGGLEAALTAVAVAGGTTKAYFPNNRAELTAALGEIISGSLPKAVCDCNGTCDSPTGDDKANFPNKGQACSVGVGECMRAGFYACTADGTGTVCAAADVCPSTPLSPGAPSMEICDGKDNNCNGQIDEGIPGGCMCAQKPELCNAMDDNCNMMIDEGIPQVPCGLNVGICKPGLSKCVSGQTICEGATQPVAEECNNLDDNCNGITDDVAPRACYPMPFAGCTYDMAAKAYTCKGVCQPGIQACVMGMWGQCVGAVTPVPEVPCDKRDNNCDGMVDENDPTATDKCYPPNVMGCDAMAGTCKGECRLGKPVCTPTGQISCEGWIGPVPELCNGKDDDCDGEIDEDFKDMTLRPNDYLGKPCDNGASGPCRKTGVFVCRPDGAGTVCNAQSSDATEEVCDGMDNDCDGMVDELPLPGVGVPCGSAVGQCMRGISMCVMGKIVCNDKGPSPEVCNGLDDDCNGVVDDKLMPPGTSCPPPGIPPERAMTGQCKPGMYVCAPDADGKWGWQCRGYVGPQMEICDGLDNDCDGKVDNDAQCPPNHQCVDGMCIRKCGAGEFECPPDSICKEGLCRLKQCVMTPCMDGFICDAEGKCIDLCDRANCAPGVKCVRGVCQDCFSIPCKAGENCIAGTCSADTCASVTCGNDSYCRNGQCVKICVEPCPTGKTCRDGQCVTDTCASSSCSVGKFCDPADGQCKDDTCGLITCMGGMTCVQSTGKCVADPCLVTHCRGSDQCVVSPTGEAHCEQPAGTSSTRQTFRVGATGGGLSDCDCNVGGAPARGLGGSAGAWLAGLVVAGLTIRRRRRPQDKKTPRR